jgi:hypothetical protein
MSKRSLIYKAKRKFRKAQMRAKMEHPFRVIKCQPGYPSLPYIAFALSRKPEHQ